VPYGIDLARTTGRAMSEPILNSSLFKALSLRACVQVSQEQRSEAESLLNDFVSECAGHSALDLVCRSFGIPTPEDDAVRTALKEQLVQPFWDQLLEARTPLETVSVKFEEKLCCDPTPLGNLEVERNEVCLTACA
jgi:hypothetical protein